MNGVYNINSLKGLLLGRTRMVGGRQRRWRSQKSLPGTIASVPAKAHQFAISQFLQAGQAKGTRKLQLHSVRERRSEYILLNNNDDHNHIYDRRKSDEMIV